MLVGYQSHLVAQSVGYTFADPWRSSTFQLRARKCASSSSLVTPFSSYEVGVDL
jgi:hypothetical protein